MAKNNYVKASDILDKVDRRGDCVISIGEGENVVEVNVRGSLSFRERCELITDVAKMSFKEDEDGTVSYAPYIFKFALDFNIINYFTNVKIPTDLEKAWEFVNASCLAERVAEVVPGDYINDIARDAKELVLYKAKKAGSNSNLDKLLGSIISIVDTFSEKLDNVTGENLVEQLSDLIPGLKEKIPTILEEKKEE